MCPPQSLHLSPLPLTPTRPPCGKPGVILCLISFLSSFRAKLCPGTACSKASLPLGPTGSSTAGPGCFHPPPQQSYFQLLVAEAATPTPQGEELRSPACGVSGDSGCHLPLGALGSWVPPGCGCMVHGTRFFASCGSDVAHPQLAAARRDREQLIPLQTFSWPCLLRTIRGPHRGPKAGLSPSPVHPPIPWLERST